MNFDLGKVAKKSSQFSPSSMFFSPIFILDFHLFKVWHEHLGEVDVRVTHLLDPRMESLRRASCILDLLLMKRLIRNTNQPPLSCPPQGSSGVCPSCSDYLQAAFTFMSKPFREGCQDQMLPKCRHCLNGGGGLTLAWIFVKDLSTCTEGPQR